MGVTYKDMSKTQNPKGSVHLGEFLYMQSTWGVYCIMYVCYSCDGDCARTTATDRSLGSGVKSAWH